MSRWEPDPNQIRMDNLKVSSLANIIRKVLPLEQRRLSWENLPLAFPDPVSQLLMQCVQCRQI